MNSWFFTSKRRKMSQFFKTLISLIVLSWLGVKKANFQGLFGDDESLGTVLGIFLCVFTSSLFCCRATSVHRKHI